MHQIFQNLIKEFQLPLSNPVLIFSLILLIILFAPIVLKRFNLPGIIGLIISGVIIGPKGLAEGTVELKRRATGERETLPLEDALRRLGA